MLELGRKYARGWGVESDVHKLPPLAKSAAEHGSLEAMEFVGIAHSKGVGTFEKDEGLVVHWLTKPAEKGFYRAQHVLGNILVTSDDEKKTFRGIALLREAARKGHKQAAFDLAMLLRIGRGGEKAKPESLTWMIVYGHVSGKVTSGAEEVYEKRLSERQIELARIEAVEIIKALPRRRTVDSTNE